jgi:hypothetical protein
MEATEKNRLFSTASLLAAIQGKWWNLCRISSGGDPLVSWDEDQLIS